MPLSTRDLFRQTEVRDARVAILVEQDIGRLQIAVNDAALVGKLNGLGDAPDSSVASRGGSGPPASRSARLWPSTKPIEKKVLAIVLADLENRHDSRMIKTGSGLGLGVEPLNVSISGELAGEDHFQRDGPVQADLPCLKDDAHSTASDLANDLVVTEVVDVHCDEASVWVDPRRPRLTVASSRGDTVASSWTDGLAMPGIGVVGKLAGATVAASSAWRSSLSSATSSAAGSRGLPRRSRPGSR